MSHEKQILNELKAIHHKVDLLIDQLPPKKQAELKNNLLESEFKDAILNTPSNPKQLQTFLKHNPVLLKGREIVDADTIKTIRRFKGTKHKY